MSFVDATFQRLLQLYLLLVVLPSVVSVIPCGRLNVLPHNVDSTKRCGEAEAEAFYAALTRHGSVTEVFIKVPTGP